MTRVHGVGGVLSQSSFDKFLQQADKALTQADKGVTAIQKATAAGNPLRALLTNVEIRTTLMPPLVFSADDLLSEWNAPPNPDSFTRYMKPTLVVRSPLLKKEKAYGPYGIAGPRDWEPLHNKVWLAAIGGIVGLLGVGVFLGYRAGKKAR